MLEALFHVSLFLKQSESSVFLFHKQVKEAVCGIGLKSHGSRKALELRYRSFRQFVETAIDNGTHHNVASLAREFNSNLCRDTLTSVTAPFTATKLTKCSSSFKHLIKLTKEHAKDVKDSCQIEPSCTDQECDEDGKLFGHDLQAVPKSDLPAEAPRRHGMGKEANDHKFLLENAHMSKSLRVAISSEDNINDANMDNSKLEVELETVPDSDGSEPRS